MKTQKTVNWSKRRPRIQVLLMKDCMFHVFLARVRKQSRSWRWFPRLSAG